MGRWEQPLLDGGAAALNGAGLPTRGCVRIMLMERGWMGAGGQPLAPHGAWVSLRQAGAAFFSDSRQAGVAFPSGQAGAALSSETHPVDEAIDVIDGGHERSIDAIGYSGSPTRGMASGSARLVGVPAGTVATRSCPVQPRCGVGGCPAPAAETSMMAGGAEAVTAAHMQGGRGGVDVGGRRCGGAAAGCWCCSEE